MSDLDFDISLRPEYALLTVRLQPGQVFYSEPGAMATMDPGVKMKSGLKGGIKKSLGRMLGGESMVINTYTAGSVPGEVTFAASTPGDTVHYHLDHNTLYLQRGAFLGHSEGVEVSAKWQGAKGFFSGQGLILLKASGTGDLFFNTYGAILEIDVSEDYIVDTGHIVAFEDTLSYQITTLKGSRPSKSIKHLMFGGEGFVCKFSGQGRVWVQTRYIHPFLFWISAFRPGKS